MNPVGPVWSRTPLPGGRSSAASWLRDESRPLSQDVRRGLNPSPRDPHSRVLPLHHGHQHAVTRWLRSTWARSRSLQSTFRPNEGAASSGPPGSCTPISCVQNRCRALGPAARGDGTLRDEPRKRVNGANRPGRTRTCDCLCVRQAPWPLDDGTVGVGWALVMQHRANPRTR